MTEDERAEKERSMSAKARRFTSKGRAAARFVAQRQRELDRLGLEESTRPRGVDDLHQVVARIRVLSFHDD